MLMLRNTDGTTAPGMGEVLNNFADSFLEYTSYFINYPKASKTLERKKDKEPFASVLRECESSPELSKLPLNSFLIKPVQRVTKYSLLLKEVMKYCPADHPDAATIPEAMIKIQATVAKMNDDKKATENIALIRKLVASLKLDEPLDLEDPEREILHDGSVVILSKNGSKVKEAATMVLFNDLFLLSSKAGILKMNKTLELWDLDSLVLNDVGDECWCLPFPLPCPFLSLVCCARQLGSFCPSPPFRQHERVPGDREYLKQI